VKELIKKRVVSADELTKLTTGDMGDMGITYDDIERIFSSEDLAEYNRLCERFVSLVGDKSNTEQWDMLFDPVAGLELVSVLNRIQELRERYNLPGVFHRLWRASPLGNGNFEYDEVSW
jgi:hypothetical protein